MSSTTTLDSDARRVRDQLVQRVASGALAPGRVVRAPPSVPAPVPLVPGYRIVDRVGSGGMGVVYAAVELATERRVAIKLVRPEQHGLAAAERILREVRALAALEHPGIVQYLGHGVTEEGTPYLVMEWLEGLDLEARLREGPLDVEETLALAIRLSGALAAAHRAGILHRDIKPANIFLAGRKPEDARLLDFGVARLKAGTWTLTIPGGIIGTPGYMSPEQARGAADIDARADLFSLGCVLHECVCGEPAFAGEHMMAVLAKVLMEDPPRARELVPGIPLGLDHLLTKLLEKDPRARPASAAELEQQLAVLGVDPVDAPPPAPAAAITGEEQVIHSVLFFRGDGPVGISTLDLARLAADHFGHHVTLVDGTHLIYIDRGRVALDRAVTAARCALALRERAPLLAIAVVCGHGLVTGRSIVGRVLDRGAELLLHARVGQIRIDDVTTRLLDTGFEVEGDEHGLVLVTMRDRLPGARRLMGKTTPLVGRRRELASLEAAFDECAEERCANVVVVIGDAGAGKSRLRHELDRRLRARAQPPVTTLIARADPMRAQAPFSLISRALYQAAGLEEGESMLVRQHKLRTRLSRHVAEEAVEHLVLYLGEIVSAFSRDAPLELELAREDAATMRQRIEHAWCTWLRAECEAGVVLLVLEDLHWGDAATVQVVDAMLEALEGSPLLVLALARPSVRQRFPKLWSTRDVGMLELSPLSLRASRELVRGVLGPAAVAADIERIVAGARGNAFFLEELIRAVAEGTGGELPDSVLAMMQARLEGLSAPERQVLRAASVFGQIAWRGGIRELVGLEVEALGSALERLVADEWLLARDRSHLPREQEYAFRHALVCDAAYATLTDHDRELGHRLAGQWLEQAGVPEAIVLAEHFRRGDDPAKATAWFASAADQAFERQEFEVVLEIVERSLEHAPSGEARGRLLLRRAEVCAISGQHHEAAASARAALAELPPNTSRWYGAAGEAALASGRAGETAHVHEIVDALMTGIRPSVGEVINFVGLVRAALPLAAAGQTDAAVRLMDEIIRVTATMIDEEPEALGPMLSARALRGLVTGDLATAYRDMEGAATMFERAKSVRNAIEHWMGAGFFALELGQLEAGEAILRRVISNSSALRLEHVCAAARHNLGRRIGEAGRVEEGLELELEALASFERHANRRMMGLTHCHLAWILLRAGRTPQATVHAAQALEQLEGYPASRAIALATRAQIRLHDRDFDGALPDAREAIEGLESLGQLQEGESLIRLTWAEALIAAGRTDEVPAAVTTAHGRLHARALNIEDEALRASFLERVPENARIERSAREWLEGR